MMSYLFSIARFIRPHTETWCECEVQIGLMLYTDINQQIQY